MKNFVSSYIVDNPENRSPKIKKLYWDVARGLQAVDGLKTSAFLDSLVKADINGDISQTELKHQLLDYYNKKKNLQRFFAADVASTNIKGRLCQIGFSFRPVSLACNHQSIFADIYSFAGEYRQVDLRKKEKVLDSKSVAYGSYTNIVSDLDRAFSEEKQKEYRNFTKENFLERFCKFIAKIWQIHPFREGNTRTIAVFSLEYLQSSGFEISKNLFKDYSKQYRESLVLACAKSDFDPLNAFYSDLLFGTDNFSPFQIVKN